ncbi:ARM repeat-containing protein [Hymenopellis radicata]|nr:ARM repeat-containing protein [Hymenopellis radicata]
MLEPAAPLQASANRWDRKSLAVAPDCPEIVDRKVKSLLNKLTMENFDSISDQIIAWANKSENEKDGRTLVQVIRLVFEKAIDEAAWSEMYARLCRKMLEQISTRVQDDGIKGQGGAPITGGHLFRKYLLNRCQEDFERGWVAKETTAAGKAVQDEADIEVYYAAQQAKRQGLGLIKFMGELFKLYMLTERIMHECVKKLLGNVDNPVEEEIESLCTLLATVGEMLDTQKARAHMDVYFSRMKELRRSSNVSSRMQLMLQDVIKLRERRWVNRNAVAAPATIAQIHEAAAREKAIAETESMSMSRGGPRRGGDRGDQQQVGPDGWTTAGSAPRAPPKAGAMSKFGQINKGSNAPLTFGPQSNIYSGKKDNRRDSIQRTNSQNMFSMLPAETPAEPYAPKEPTQLKRLVLAPRFKPNESATADAKKKSEEDVQEFFVVRKLEEAEDYFKSLPASHHHLLVRKLVSSAIESKEADAQLVGDFFARVSSKSLCASAAFEKGIARVAEFLDDITIDAPKAPNLLAIMIKGADLSEEQRTRIASKSEESGAKLLGLIDVRVRRHPIRFLPVHRSVEPLQKKTRINPWRNDQRGDLGFHW